MTWPDPMADPEDRQLPAMRIDAGTLGAPVAVVTGAGSGIGRAIATRLVQEGALVCLVGRTAEKLDAVVEALTSGGGRAIPYPVDLSREEELVAFAGNLQRDWERLDILVHCAGTYAASKLRSSTSGEFDSMYAVNTRAPLALTRELLPRLEASQGQVVFMNSSAGIRSRAGVGQYAASKHALRALADALRAEVNPHGVRVLSVYPGQTATAMQAAIYEAAGRTYRPEELLQPDDVASMVLSALALPRTAEVTEIMIRPMSKPS